MEKVRTGNSRMALVLCTGIILPLFSPLTITTVAWSNGECSTQPSVPNYGTHDWIAGHALDFLPQNEKRFIEDNLTMYLYATELPDCPGVPDGIGDQAAHHVYYHSNRTLQDDVGADRAQSYYQDASVALVLRDFQRAARSAGILSHYLSDVAVFANVMGEETDWGNETHDADYEDYVNDRTSEYNDEFNTYLRFDGSFEPRTAYDATLTLAYDTTFDASGRGRDAPWMNSNYDWTNSVFQNRAGESLNLAVNLLADVLHFLWQQNQPGEYSVIPYVVLAVAIVVIAIVVVYRRRRERAATTK